MASLKQLIIEEQESSSLDFKAIQYKKEKYEDFLVDIVAMANADTKRAKYIIIGVKAFSNGSKEFLGISETFIDEATYQQLINDNIEPDIKLDYHLVSINNVQLGVFHIYDCDDPPYMLKKDYGKLRRGDCYIRKGTHQTRATRSDFDKLYRLVIERRNKIEDLEVKCLINGKSTNEIKAIKKLNFPSDVAAEEIKEVLKKKEEEIAMLPGLPDIDVASLGGTPYERRSTKTLRQNLKNVKKTYEEDDLFYLLEEQSFKINFVLLNQGKVYLEDACVEIEVKASDGLTIASKIFRKPDTRSNLAKWNSPVQQPDFDNLSYPEVKKVRDKFTIFESIGNLKHLIPSKVFKTPVRLVLTTNYPSDSLTFILKIFGKSLEKPIEKLVELTVVK